MKYQLLFSLAAALTLAGCTHYATVSEKYPEFRAQAAAGTVDPIEERIVGAMRQEKREPLAAVGELLVAAEAAAQKLAQNPKDTATRENYNFAISRVFGIIKKAKLDPWTQPLRVPAEGGEFVLTRRKEMRKMWNPALYTFTPADQFDVKGTYVSDRTRKEGVGATLVAVSRELNADARENFTMAKTYYGVTAVAHFEGRKCTIAFEDPLAVENVTLKGRSFPLAADFTVPLAVMLAETEPEKLELSRLLRPEEYAETARISRLQPYDPNKTVVLVIHGLMDSPATWAPMLNHLRGDEEIRKNYQFWFYSYPSGYPYPYSASILRQELDGVEKKFPLRKKMVVIGHSMGGCISRLLITDTTDEKLWLALAKKRPDELGLSPDTRKLLTDSLIFRNRPEVGRVIFIAAPLRGSDLATHWMGRLGSMLVRAPAKLLTASTDVMKVVTFQGDELRLKRIPNSVDTLAPNNRFVRAIQTMPLTPGVPHNVISGDRGKGGNKDKTKPVMADGVVPYWSSHMDTAESELVVPSSHSAHQNPLAIAEVRRILTKHKR